MRRYQGNVPSDELGYRLTSDVCHDGVVWLLYTRDSQCEKWVSIKLVANEPVSVKANYWFGYSLATERFSGHRDYHLLKENRPELLIKVINELSEYYG